MNQDSSMAMYHKRMHKSAKKDKHNLNNEKEGSYFVWLDCLPWSVSILLFIKVKKKQVREKVEADVLKDSFQVGPTFFVSLNRDLYIDRQNLIHETKWLFNNTEWLVRPVIWHQVFANKKDIGR